MVQSASAIHLEVGCQPTGCRPPEDDLPISLLAAFPAAHPALDFVRQAGPPRTLSRFPRLYGIPMLAAGMCGLKTR